MNTVKVIKNISLSLAFSIASVFAYAENTIVDSSLDISSDVLEIERLKGYAMFTGSVKALYQDMILNADKLIINYDEKSKSKDKIKSVIAIDNVQVIQGKDTINSDYAEYFMNKDDVIFKKNVILNRSGNVLTGEHLVLNKITKKATMKANPGQRVKAIYYKNSQ